MRYVGIANLADYSATIVSTIDRLFANHALIVWNSLPNQLLKLVVCGNQNFGSVSVFSKPNQTEGFL